MLGPIYHPKGVKICLWSVTPGTIPVPGLYLVYVIYVGSSVAQKANVFGTKKGIFGRF